MANYLERVASSAGRRAAIAKPPSSGPPLLPARDLSLPAEESWPMEDDQSFGVKDDQVFEASGQGQSPRREASRPEGRAETMPAPESEGAGDSATTQRRDSSTPAQAEPAAKAAASQESLSSESPFTLYLPKTLRPITDAKLPPTIDDEQAGEPIASPASGKPASSDPTSTGFTFEEADTKVARSSVSQSSNPEPGESVRPELKTEKLPVLATAPFRSEQRQPPTFGEIETEAIPIPRVEREDRANKITAHSTSQRDEPLPAVAPVQTPLHIPPVVIGNTVRQEQSRISIGSLEVMVNNHQPLEPLRPPASAPLRSENVNLERRYLDRFRLRH